MNLASKINYIDSSGLKFNSLSCFNNYYAIRFEYFGYSNFFVSVKVILMFKFGFVGLRVYYHVLKYKGACQLNFNWYIINWKKIYFKQMYLIANCIYLALYLRDYYYRKYGLWKWLIVNINIKIIYLNIKAVLTQFSDMNIL